MAGATDSGSWGRQTIYSKLQDTQGKLSPLAYVTAIPMAFVNPWISCALYGAVALVWLVPDRRIERRLVADA